MLKVATFIVDRRNLFFLLIGIALIFSAIASRWVKVENDLAAYLPDSALTEQDAACTIYRMATSWKSPVSGAEYGASACAPPPSSAKTAI